MSHAVDLVNQSDAEEGALLLGEEEEQPPQLSRRFRPGMLAGVGAVAVAIVWCVVHRHSTLPVSTTALLGLSINYGIAGSNGIAPRSVMFDPNIAESIACYTYTGRSCSLEECDVSRGATCSMNKCVCEAACAGADGKCYIGVQNQPVATSFTLTNVYWPRYSMYFLGANVLGQMKTTAAYSWLNIGKDKFNLYKLPGPANQTRFLLGSGPFLSQVAHISERMDSSSQEKGELVAADLSEGRSPDDIAATVCWHAEKGAIMIGNKVGTRWAYIHRHSWMVFASSAARCKVGAAGLWSPTPPLTAQQIDMMPACC